MDEDVVEIGNVESVCRLCLSTDETRSSVFATQGHEDPSGVSLITKIEACLSIQVNSKLLHFVYLFVMPGTARRD